MPFSGSSALHGVNPNQRKYPVKKKKDIGIPHRPNIVNLRNRIGCYGKKIVNETSHLWNGSSASISSPS